MANSLKAHVSCVVSCVTDTTTRTLLSVSGRYTECTRDKHTDMTFNEMLIRAFDTVFPHSVWGYQVCRRWGQGGQPARHTYVAALSQCVLAAAATGAFVCRLCPCVLQEYNLNNTSIKKNGVKPPVLNERWKKCMAGGWAGGQAGWAGWGKRVAALPSRLVDRCGPTQEASACDAIHPKPRTLLRVQVP